MASKPLTTKMQEALDLIRRDGDKHQDGTYRYQWNGNLVAALMRRGLVEQLPWDRRYVRQTWADVHVWDDHEGEGEHAETAYNCPICKP